MTDSELQVVRHAFASLSVLTGIGGTLCQVVAAWLNQLGGPREPHVAALLPGMAGTRPQDIAIFDRRLIALAATTMSSYGAAILFAALVAGLVTNFPDRWIAGLMLWAATVALSSAFILLSAYRTAFRLRKRQEDLFDELPQDGEESIIQGHVYETAAYRQQLISQKPDLATRISTLSKLRQAWFLVFSIKQAYRRERMTA